MGRLFIVATPIGNLSDLTARAGKTLAATDHILAEDTRRAGILLRHLGLRKRSFSLHAHNEASRVPKVLRWLAEGEDVALISDAGTPLISDPGARLARATTEAGHEVIAIPGPSAVLAALVASGLPCVPFTFVGFLPRKTGKRQRSLAQIAAAAETTVLFESATRLTVLLEELRDLTGPEREVAVCRELTKVHEETVRGSIAEVVEHFAEHPPRGEVTVVLEGKPEAQSEVETESAEELANSLLAEQLPPASAAKELASRTGLSRGKAYEVILKVKGDR